MSFAHKLQYAGSDPYKPEADRQDISPRELEQLEQDEIYVRLAELRWLADELEVELNRDDLANESGAWDTVFDAIAADAAPLQVAVERYVDAWLADFRTPSRSEPADFGGGESTGVQEL